MGKVRLTQTNKSKLTGNSILSERNVNLQRRKGEGDREREGEKGSTVSHSLHTVPYDL